MQIKDIKGMKVLVMGLGLNGGGLESAKFFAKHGADVIVTDLKSMEQLKPSVLALSCFKNINFCLSRHDIKDFENADLVIKNPAVKTAGNQYLSKAKWIESDISIFTTFNPAKIIAVTGTKGKSFSSKAIHYGLSQLGFASFLGGNIGRSPLSFLEELTEDSVVVLELSSWQLGDLKYCRRFKPHIALITPIMPDHQNYYSNMQEYVEDKKIIYKNMDRDDYLILNYDDEWGRYMAEDARANLFWYSLKPLPENIHGSFLDSNEVFYFKNKNNTVELIEEPLKVFGLPSRQNLANATLAISLLGGAVNKTRELMKNFEGVEHRMELFFKSHSGLSFYNDSAATIPEATIMAISSFKEKPILIAGGTDKLLDFHEFAKNANKAKKIFLLKGSATDKIIASFKTFSIEYMGPYSSLEELLKDLKKETEEGDNVVFSPASTSFELFKNEFDRGKAFKKAVREIFS